jgi:molybdenum-dependent DNA-binding transcriptional regulator ModE
MAKTRSQTLNIAIKKEEDCKPNLSVNSVTVTARKHITKRKPFKAKNKTLPAQQVKLEQDTDTKSLLKSESRSLNNAPRPRISQEQINQLIHYIANDNMNITKAARKAKISYTAGYYYQKLYKDDPEKRIPLPRDQISTVYTQEQIGNLIRYINSDKMTLTEASVKANMAYHSAYHYYNKYLKDPNHAIPVPQFHQKYSQDQKNEFIAYISMDKMSILAASKKVNLSFSVARRLYYKHFKVQNPHIATRNLRRYTQEQINQVISYIGDDKMSITAASRKANISLDSARKYYRQYLKDNNMEIPVKKTGKRYTQDDMNKFIGYIVNDKMSIRAASKKANMSCHYGTKYYHQYLHGQKRNRPTRRPRVVPDFKND